METFKNIFLCTIFLVLASKDLKAQSSEEQKKVKDSLFFKLDLRVLRQGTYEKNYFYSIHALNDKGSSETFFFEVIDTTYGLNPEIVLNITDFFKKSKFSFPEREKNNFYDFGMAEYLQQYIIYLVDSSHKHCRFIEVFPRTEID